MNMKNENLSAIVPTGCRLLVLPTHSATPASRLSILSLAWNPNSADPGGALTLV
jgi:hypothetical protein